MPHPNPVKRVLFVSHRVPYPPNKGEKIRTFNQIKFLKETGHQISLLSLIESAEDISHLNALKEDYCEEARYEKIGGKLKMALGLLRGKALSVSNFYSQELQRKFDTILTTIEPDAIVFTSSSMAEYMFQSRSKHAPEHIKLIMDFMDLDSDKWAQYQRLHSFPLNMIYKREARIINAYERRIHSQFDHCVFVSQNEVDLFAQRVSDTGKISVIANGIDTDVFQPATASFDSRQPPKLLFTGVMDYFPNVDAVVWFCENVWPAVLKSFPGAQFYIAGMNPNKKVMALAQLPGVTVTGFVDDIVDYFQKSDIFVAPFRVARGVQNKVLQAFACGLPVVSTPLGLEGIKCKPNVDGLVASDANEFIQHIETLRNDPATAEKLTKNALRLVQDNYSWQSQLVDLEALIVDPATDSEKTRAS